MITICLTGTYWRRSPLAYAAIRDLCDGAFTITQTPNRADLVSVAHSRDLAAAAEGLGPGQRLLLLSEEPLWDTVWSADPLHRHQQIDTPSGHVPFCVLNHHTSTLFDFSEIPYFLLTDSAFFPRYSRWFSRQSERSPQEWRAAFDRVKWDIAFVAELRQSAEFDAAWPAQDLFGMGALRTRIALACTQGRVLRTGAGWNTLPKRQDLPDWHLEKFLDLDGRCRFLSGIENTHQNNYISEKLFDAYAVGAVPLYIAGPDHLAHRLIPEDAFVNLYGLAPEAAAQHIADFALDQDILERYAAVQRRLAALFATPAAMQREKTRLRAALILELESVLAE